MAVSESCSKSFQTSDVSGEFEYSENSQDSEDLSRLGDVLERVGWGDEIETNRDKEGEDSKKINDVEERGDEIKLVGSNNQPENMILSSLIVFMNSLPDNILQRKPSNKDGLGNTEEVAFFVVRGCLGWNRIKVFVSVCGQLFQTPWSNQLLNSLMVESCQHINTNYKQTGF